MLPYQFEYLLQYPVVRLPLFIQEVLALLEKSCLVVERLTPLRGCQKRSLVESAHQSRNKLSYFCLGHLVRTSAPRIGIHLIYYPLCFSTPELASRRTMSPGSGESSPSCTRQRIEVPARGQRLQAFPPVADE